MFLCISSLLNFISFFVLLTPALSHNCPKTCGSLNITYPFGVGPGCSMDPSFDIICNETTHPPKAYLNITNGRLLEIVEINSRQVRVNYPYLLAVKCYSNTSVCPHNHTRDGNYYLNLTDTRYVVSDENWLTALGCDDIVAGFGLNNESLAGGCVAYCNNKAPGFGICPNNENEYSAGKGCCRSPIPKGTASLAGHLSNLSGKLQRDKFFPCSYAFLQEKQTSLNKSVLRYPLSELNKSAVMKSTDDSWMFSMKPPVVRLEWSVGTVNCSEARRNSTAYACKSDSYCIDFDGNRWRQGYICQCNEGYHGNPYLDKGCKDINECDDSRRNPCASNSICLNTVGSVNCSCPSGYQGDGLKHGTGCIPLKMVNVFIGVGSGMGFLLLLSLCILVHIICRKRRNKLRKEKFFKRNGGLLLQQQTNGGIVQKTKHFSIEELEKATDNFNESRVLGQGGQGTVYKGMLSDGKIVAIKKSKLVNKDQLQQFINEVVIVSQINHKNVVKLWGCCLETDVPLLVYELVPNGTLSDLIHDPTIEFQVSWNMRLKIATDVAGALAYLHSALSVPIYHRDIKSSNILLDEKYIVKLSDFGISMSVATDRTHLTTLVKGTFGYFDPEYFRSSKFTEKSDVYSFGVVLVELLTGKKPICSDVREEERSLVTRFLELMEENDFYSILDPQVSKQGNEEEVNAVACLAQRCLNWKGKLRPTMKEVAIELERLRICDETRVPEAKSMMISDIEYTWTTSDVSQLSSSSLNNKYTSF